jgi:hypothetical protein
MTAINNDNNEIPVVQNSNSDSALLSPSILNTFEQYGHMIIVGPTNAGKTHRIKTFFCDQKFANYDEYIFTGPKSEIDEMAACFVAQNYLDGKSHENKKMKFYPLDNILDAILYCEQNVGKENKLFFIDDALVQSSRITKAIANFCSQAKNSNTTLAVTVHDPLGDSERKSIRHASRYYVCINITKEDLKRMVGIDPNSKVLRKYDQIQEPRKRIIIYDKNNREFYGENYQQFI